MKCTRYVLIWWEPHPPPPLPRPSLPPPALCQVGEIARAAAIFEVDEIVVYDDLSVSRKGQGGVRDDSATVNFNARGGDAVGGRGGRGGGGRGDGAAGGGRGRGGGRGDGGGGGDRNNPNVFMARLLQVRVALYGSF